MKKEVIIKKTQGYHKLRQYVGDLLRNKSFAKDAKRLVDAYGKMPDTYDEIEKIVNEYRELDKKAARFEKRHRAEMNRMSRKMAEKYGLNLNLLRPILFHYSLSNKPSIDQEMKDFLAYGDAFDMCHLVDNSDEQLDPVWPPMPFALDTHKQDHFRAFPVSVDIHKFASKRDVLDFIEKEWPIIENNLYVYRDGKSNRFRKRKIERGISDLIWENKHLPISQIKIELDKKFPSSHLQYYEIGKIISIEKRRRLGKLA